MTQLRHAELANEFESIKTNTYYVFAGLMTGHRAQGHVAGSIFSMCFLFFRLFFSLKKLSQLRGAEAATKH